MITYGYSTDVGIQKQINEDSLLIKKAVYNENEIVLAVVCDGMGGLQSGEVASSTIVSAFYNWFENEMIDVIINKNFKISHLKYSITPLVNKQNNILFSYGQESNITLGTTCTGIMLYKGEYLIFHIGDSRVYGINQNLFQITKDHSFIQQEIDAGRLTEEQARFDPRRSVLTRCIGATSAVNVDYYEGEYHQNDGFLLCSDGFRHIVSYEEIFNELKGKNDFESISSSIQNLIELNKQRNEVDNITALMVKIVDGN